MKGFVTIVEVISVIITILIAFELIIPRFTYTTKWDRALVILKSRDILVSADRIEKLYNLTEFKKFLEKTRPIDLVYTISTENLIKEDLSLACNCSVEFENIILNWFEGGIIINGRRIGIKPICHTELEKINEECMRRGIDVLIIEGNNSLDYSNCVNTLKDLLDRGIGIVELINLTNPSQLGEMQKKIFGIKYCNGCNPSESENYFSLPSSASQITYEAYKLFHHLPIPIKSGSEFRFRDQSFIISICGNKACIDGKSIGEREEFTLSNFTFFLNYIRNPYIYISFRPPYNFTDFLGDTRVIQADSDENKILINRGNYGSDIAPVVVVNGTLGKAVWTTNFVSPNAGDDLRTLLLSLILYASNKETREKSRFKLIYLTPYLNVKNEDMYEVYNLQLGLGYPY